MLGEPPQIHEIHDSRCSETRLNTGFVNLIVNFVNFGSV